jgi:hypothetical protein
MYVYVCFVVQIIYISSKEITEKNEKRKKTLYYTITISILQTIENNSLTKPPGSISNPETPCLNAPGLTEGIQKATFI